MREIGAFEAKNTLGTLLDMVEPGEEVIITRHNKPVAKIVPISSAPAHVAEDIPPFIQRTFDMGEPLVDLTKANQLVGELEDQHFLELNRRLEAEAAVTKKAGKA